MGTVFLLEPHGLSIDHMPTWKMLKIICEYKKQDRLYLCTDYPEEAKKFFEEK